MNHVSQSQPSPRVTVIIPAFKAQHTLERAVRSVLSQTERSLEVVIVDDCSPDQTLNVAMALAKEDKRVSVVCLRENGGKPIAMNKGTELARGKWTAVVDADDWCAPTRLERLIEAAERAGVEMAADNQIMIDADTAVEAGHAFPPSSGERMLGLDSFLTGSNPLQSFDLGMLKPVFRTDFIRKHKVVYDPVARNGHDFYVLLCFFVAGGQALLLEEPFYYYVRANRAVQRRATHVEGRRYRYDLMKQTNDYYLERFSGRLTVGQRRKLVERGRNLEVMRRLHQLKSRLRARDVAGAARVALASPLHLWVALVKRATARVSRSA